MCNCYSCKHSPLCIVWCHKVHYWPPLELKLIRKLLKIRLENNTCNFIYDINLCNCCCIAFGKERVLFTLISTFLYLISSDSLPIACDTLSFKIQLFCLRALLNVLLC